MVIASFLRNSDRSFDVLPIRHGSEDTAQDMRPNSLNLFRSAVGYAGLRSIAPRLARNGLRWSSSDASQWSTPLAASLAEAINVCFILKRQFTDH